MKNFNRATDIQYQNGSTTLDLQQLQSEISVPHFGSVERPSAPVAMEETGSASEFVTESARGAIRKGRADRRSRDKAASTA